MLESPLLRTLIAADPEKRRKMLAQMPDAMREEAGTHWEIWGRPQQQAPQADWRT